MYKPTVKLIVKPLLISLIQISLLLSFSLGCKDDDEKYIKVRRPSIWKKMSPTQKDYYQDLNKNQKKLLEVYSNPIEQWEAFTIKWQEHTGHKD